MGVDHFSRQKHRRLQSRAVRSFKLCRRPQLQQANKRMMLGFGWSNTRLFHIASKPQIAVFHASSDADAIALGVVVRFAGVLPVVIGEHALDVLHPTRNQVRITDNTV